MDLSQRARHSSQNAQKVYRRILISNVTMRSPHSALHRPPAQLTRVPDGAQRIRKSWRRSARGRPASQGGDWRPQGDGAGPMAGPMVGPPLVVGLVPGRGPGRDHPSLGSEAVAGPMAGGASSWGATSKGAEASGGRVLRWGPRWGVAPQERWAVAP